MFVTTWKTRIRYAETDQMGYCYYGNYAVFFEMGRVEALRSIGIRYRDLEDQGIMPRWRNWKSSTKNRSVMTKKSRLKPRFRIFRKAPDSHSITRSLTKQVN